MSSHVNYHTHHFVSCIDADIQHNARKLICSIIKESELTQDIQADVVHLRMANMFYSVERG